MYKKLTQDFITHLPYWQQFCGDTVAKFVSGDVTLEYYGLQNVEHFRKLHLRSIFGIKPDRVTLATITGQGFLAPHKDHNTLVTLNYYAQASDDITIFYKTVESAKAKQYEGKEQANIFDVNDLIEDVCFIANSNEAFLLDVSQVHAVLKKSVEPRVFISYAWEKTTYQQVLDSLKIK
jgi:hypothetical protein